MQLKVKVLKFLAGRPIAILNAHTAVKINVHIGERILVSDHKESIISVVDTSRDDFLKQNEIALSTEILKALDVKEEDFVEVSLAEKPVATSIIRKKMDGHKLSGEEINFIIKSIVENALTEPEIAFFVSSVYKNGMSEEELINLVKAMVSTGTRLSFHGKVVDKHSIGGIAANRTTPIVVSICAAAGLIMPKTSSRAITSASGTADTIESIARVEFSPVEIKRIVRKTGACMVWGGSIGLSPADDKLIQIERILNLDPEAQLLASVLSKKISVGSKYVLIDIPYGKSAKVNKKKAVILKTKFERIGKKFGLNLECILTNGEQPIGRGVGPLLEIRDVVSVLKREDSPLDLENKAVLLAGKIFELCHVVNKGKGESLARDILDSGRAFDKFKQIIEAQEGNVPTLREIDSMLANMQYDLTATRDGKIKEIDNKAINTIAGIAGSPMDKGAGILLIKHVGEVVKKGDLLMKVYSDSKIRLNNVLSILKKSPIIY